MRGHPPCVCLPLARLCEGAPLHVQPPGPHQNTALWLADTDSLTHCGLWLVTGHSPRRPLPRSLCPPRPAPGTRPHPSPCSAHCAPHYGWWSGDNYCHYHFHHISGHSPLPWRMTMIHLLCELNLLTLARQIAAPHRSRRCCVRTRWPSAPCWGSCTWWSCTRDTPDPSWRPYAHWSWLDVNTSWSININYPVL